MKIYSIIILFLGAAMTACQMAYKARKLVSEINSVDEVLILEKKYPKSDMAIHKLDSQAFFSHRIYSRLKPGILMQIGQEDGQGADLYKLIRPDQTRNADTLYYYVLQFHLN